MVPRMTSPRSSKRQVPRGIMVATRLVVGNRFGAITGAVLAVAVPKLA
jgi:hypothetical protein